MSSKKYSIKEINLYPGTEILLNESKVYTGDFLMKVGVNPILNTKRTSVVLLINEIQ